MVSRQSWKGSQFSSSAVSKRPVGKLSWEGTISCFKRVRSHLLPQFMPLSRSSCFLSPFNHRYPSNHQTHSLVAPASAPRSFTAHHNYQRVENPEDLLSPRPLDTFKAGLIKTAHQPYNKTQQHHLHKHRLSKCSSRASSPSWPLASLWLPPRKPPTAP